MNRKKKSHISLGPGAASLILIFVVLSMSVLGMLALMNGRSDAQLSSRSIQVIEAVYALNQRAEERRAELDSILAKAAASAGDEEGYRAAVAQALPEDVTLEEDILSWTESDGTRALDCALQLQPLGGDSRAVWVRHNLSAEVAEEW